MAFQNTDLCLRARPIFDEAITLRKDDRLQYIIRACGEDSVLLRYCEKLLLSVRGDPTFAQEFLQSEFPNDQLSLVGESINHYRLNKLIGTGGMGDVYAAARTDRVHDTQVAIKLVRGWGNTSDMVSRFKQERKILASLKHPNIAQFLDGGLSQDGRPYFVMEYVDGVWINEYCKLHRLGLEERLQLFLKVCNTVVYAHQQHIIHRDIKPGNILVTRDNEVKLLDFGIAKILDDNQEGEHHQTVAGLPLTPRYSSPEQVLNQPLSTASDQFSLGVLLYELLTECSPYKITKDSNNFDILRQVCEILPDRLVAKAKANTELAVNNRRRFLSQLSGNIELIVAKALEKSPADRYDSVQHFVEDVQRFLERKPVLVRSATWLYVASKHARRHWKGIAVASCLLTLFSIQQVRLIQQQQHLLAQQDDLIAEKDLARQKNLELLQVQSFLTDLFKLANPKVANGQDINVETLLREGVAKIQMDLKEQPRIKANLLYTTGSAHNDLLPTHPGLAKVLTAGAEIQY